MIQMINHGRHVDSLGIEDVSDEEEPINAATIGRINTALVDELTTPPVDPTLKIFQTLARAHETGMVTHSPGRRGHDGVYGAGIGAFTKAGSIKQVNGRGKGSRGQGPPGVVNRHLTALVSCDPLCRSGSAHLS